MQKEIFSDYAKQLELRLLDDYSIFFFFLYYVFIVMVQELTCSANYGVNKTSISKHNNKGKTISVCLQVCQILDTSLNIQLRKESKTRVKAKQLF